MKKCLILFLFLFFGGFSHAQILLEFCPVSKIQAAKDWGATVTIRNNTGVELDFANNKMVMEWPSLVTLPYPFENHQQTGINWAFNIAQVVTWDSKMPDGATWDKKISGGKFSGVLQFPTEGFFIQDGTTYTIEVNHCMQTNPYELYDAKVEFDRNCFIYSPTENLCLGEAATEVWSGEGIFDAMIPTDRPSWAIATMVAHRLFTNMVGQDVVSPNFWSATALNESRWVCDPTIVPNTSGSHWPINSQANSGTGVDTRTDNCFQVVNLGYTQIENNQPDLFAQTNAFGTASYSTVIAAGKWETGAIAVAYYNYQNIRYWKQIQCADLKQIAKDTKDEYAVEKILYHAFHDGFNPGITLINDIEGNYLNAVSASDMNDVINTGGSWSNMGAANSQKVGNMTSLLDGGGAYPYRTDATNQTTEYYGCYSAGIKWSDIFN